VRGFPEPAVEFRLLGPFEVAIGGQPQEIGSAKQRTLLAVLSLQLNRVVPIDTLADALWEESPPPSLRSTLQSLVSRIRQALTASEPAARCVDLRARNGGYLLEADPEAVDIHRFDRLILAGRERVAGGELERAVANFEVALTLWRGPALADFADRDFGRVEAERLEESRLAVTEDLAEAQLALGRPDEALALLQPFVAANPLRERAWGGVMLALYRLGRQAEALRAYQDVRRTLVEEIGVEPSPALRRLEKRILAQADDLDPPGAPAVRHNLPSLLTRFVGRRRELAELERLQPTARLLTLTGAGGAGKTRLALELSTKVVDGHPDGVWLIDLAPVAEPAQVAFEVAAALGIATSGVGPDAEGLERRLAEHLRPRRALLVLDNCEHVIAAVAPLAGRLLVECPDLAVVATSRELLGVPGEVVWRVPALSLPPAGATRPEELAASDAVALLCARAPGDFSLTEGNAAAVAEICRRLDGIPLALELAAARLRHLSAEQVATGLDDRFRLLGSASRIVSARHRTLRATMDWSYDLLSPPEQAVLLRLGVFTGDFDLGAAQAVASDTGRGEPEVLDRLAQLVDKSLVAVEAREPEARYRLLETVRAYATERLREAGEDAAARRRHGEHFLGLVHPAHDAWFCGAIWADKPFTVWSNYENFRTALEWFLAAGDADGSLGLAAGLWAYWLLNGLDLEGSVWIDRALALPRPPPSVALVESLLGAAILSASSGRRSGPEALALAEEASRLADEVGGPVVPRSHAVRSELELGRGDLARAARLAEQALAGCEALGLVAGAGWSDQRLAWVAMAGGDRVAAGRHFEQAAGIGRAAKDPLTGHGLTAHALAARAGLVALSGDRQLARELAGEAVEAARHLPLRQVQVMALVRAAESALITGDWEAAEPALSDALGILAGAGARSWVADVLEQWSMVQEAGGRPESAARLLGAAENARATLGERPSSHRCLAAAVDRCRDRLAATLSREVFDGLLAAGRTVGIAEAVSFALSEVGPRAERGASQKDRIHVFRGPEPESRAD
jgi:predicted ATPase/DNA-binding SARP family transcriptional activator